VENFLCVESNFVCASITSHFKHRNGLGVRRETFLPVYVVPTDGV